MNVLIGHQCRSTQKNRPLQVELGRLKPRMEPFQVNAIRYDFQR
jgi:hypothetical protein